MNTKRIDRRLAELEKTKEAEIMRPDVVWLTGIGKMPNGEIGAVSATTMLGIGGTCPCLPFERQEGETEAEFMARWHKPKDCPLKAPAIGAEQMEGER